MCCSLLTPASLKNLYWNRFCQAVFKRAQNVTMEGECTKACLIQESMFWAMGGFSSAQTIYWHASFDDQKWLSECYEISFIENIKNIARLSSVFRRSS